MGDLDGAIRAKLAADEAGDEYWPNYKDAIEAVLDLHGPSPRDPIGWHCCTCESVRTCPTVRAIAEKLGVEVPR